MAEKHDEKDPKKKGGHDSGGHGGGHGGGGHGGGAHGGGGGHEEHEGAPEWLISFADNVTLMMGFFVIMLAMNMKPASGGEGGGEQSGGKPSTQMLDLAIAVREGFHNPVDLSSTNPADQALIRRIIERRGQTEPHEPGPRGDDHDLQSIRPSDYHQLSGAVQFEDGSAMLTDTSKEAIRDIAGHMRGLRLILEVRGHASAAEAYPTGDRGMKLSFNRAITVSRALAEAGLDWRQMRLIASGDNDRMRLLAHDKPGQRSNQRVEVIVTNEAMPETPEGEEESPASSH